MKTKIIIAGISLLLGLTVSAQEKKVLTAEEFKAKRVSDSSVGVALAAQKAEAEMAKKEAQKEKEIAKKEADKAKKEEKEAQKEKDKAEKEKEN